MEPVEEEKRAIRAAMKRLRRAMPPSERAALSGAICERLLARADVMAAIAAHGTFAVYLAAPDEVDLSQFIARLWSEGCPVAVPAWREGSYRLVRYARGMALAAGPMGIREPGKDAESVAPHDVACWIAPGLAFTPQGARLGYGGGWYDRFLSGAAQSAVALGVAFPFQVVPTLPTGPHDIALTAVVAP